MSFATSYFTNVNHTVANAPFRTDLQAENEIDNAPPCRPLKLAQLDHKYGEFQSNYGAILYFLVSSNIYLPCSIIRLGHFITMPCSLEYLLTHKPMHYLNSRPNKPLMFPKQVA